MRNARAQGEARRHEQQVQDGQEPISYNHRLYQPGETLEAQKDEDMEGFVQAGYVERAADKKPKATRKRSKKLFQRPG